VASITDTLLWYSKNAGNAKFRRLFDYKGDSFDPQYSYYMSNDGTYKSLSFEEKLRFPIGLEIERVIQPDNLTKPGPGAKYDVKYRGKTFNSGKRWWGTTADNMQRLLKAGRIVISGSTIRYARRFIDSRYLQLSNLWTGFLGQTNPTYVVQTNTDIVQRCILMSTDPGDLILDPTCGSGTTAYVAEQWGRRWITTDTSRVALALARARIMGARYPYYLLTDSRDGQIKEAEIMGATPSEVPTYGNIRQGFVCERVPIITPSVIANNTEIDVIWDKYQEIIEPLRDQFNKVLKQNLQEWEIPIDAGENWSEVAKRLHAEWWKKRIALKKEIDASIASNADFEYLYDKPYETKKKVRVAGPFTVESLSPHRELGVDENDELIDSAAKSSVECAEERDFVRMILENLKIAGVQQSHKEDKITFSSITPWPGELVCAEGRYFEGDEDTGTEKRAAIFIGPEFGTVSRPDLVAVAREAGDADFDALIACAFNYDAHSSEFNKLGRIPILKARMNADLHMADDLKNTGKGNLFVIFGEPDIDILDVENGQIQVKINGVDVFHPNTGEVRSDGAEGIACWFIDSDYNEESFFVRHAYFLGTNDPYKALKTTLKAEINKEAWDTLNSDTSRPFNRPSSGRIAVKVINHLGDEVMKVFRVD
jgi:adenine-specific DNA-methyltransferase